MRQNPVGGNKHFSRYANGQGDLRYEDDLGFEDGLTPNTLRTIFKFTGDQEKDFVPELDRDIAAKRGERNGKITFTEDSDVAY